ncbi:hypothetical protein HELRODRAFT_78883, partial [Helobdella robusta]|uniref:Uncharacterized protein n=1 Tax=Helobdella robusta TaxID=6412 RepID=T1G3G8_HELRO
SINKQSEKKNKVEDDGESSMRNKEDEQIRKRYNLSDSEDDDMADDSDDSYGMSSLAFFKDNKQDPYLSKGTKDDTDDEMLNISPDDNVVLAGKTDDGFFSLEMWVYNEQVGNDSLYCHHDYILPSCPLVVQWLGGDIIGGRNAGVVGDLDGNVSLWDLEMVNYLDPMLVLRGCKERTSKKKKKLKTASEEKCGHSDAVLSLSWNEQQSNLLASSSADASIALWDLGGPGRQNCVFLGKHQDKVQSIQWHPVEAQMLLAGSADSTVQVFDCRCYDDSVKRWSLSGEVEKVLWNISSPFNFFAGTSNGFIHYLDIRMDVPVFELDAHGPSSVTDLSMLFVNSQPFNDCLLSSSEDGFVKVWSLSNDAKLVNKKNYKIGTAFCLAACCDFEKPIFAVGGDNEMKVVDLSGDEKSCEAFNWSLSEKLLKKKSKESSEATCETASKVPKKKLKDKKYKKLKEKNDLSNLNKNEDVLDDDDEDDGKVAEEQNLMMKEVKCKMKKKKNVAGF